MADDETEAALELTLLSIDIFTTNPNNTSLSWLNPTRCYAVAWLDSTTKQTAGPIPTNPKRNSTATKPKKKKLYFSISPETLKTLQSPFVTIQVLSRSRLPFHGAKLVGTAMLPLSSVPMSAQTFVLPLRRSSGQVRGSVTVSARVLWDLGFRVPVVVDDDDVIECVDSAESEVIDACDWSYAVDGTGGSIEPSAPPEPESVELPPVPSPEGGGDGGNLLLSLVLGVFVALVVGAVACRRWRAKTILLIGR